MFYREGRRIPTRPRPVFRPRSKVTALSFASRHRARASNGVLPNWTWSSRRFGCVFDLGLAFSGDIGAILALRVGCGVTRRPVEGPTLCFAPFWCLFPGATGLF